MVFGLGALVLEKIVGPMISPKAKDPRLKT